MSICYSLKQEGKREQNRQLNKEICQNVGKQRGIEVAIRVSNDRWRSKENQICNHTLKAFKAICGGFQQALAKSDKTNGAKQEITTLLSVVSSALTVASHCSAVNEICELCISFSKELLHLLEAEMKDRATNEGKRDKEKTEKENLERDVTCILDELMDNLGQQVEAVLENKLLKPLLHHCANKLVMATGELMKNMKIQFDTRQHEQKLKKIVQKNQKKKS